MVTGLFAQDLNLQRTNLKTANDNDVNNTQLRTLHFIIFKAILIELSLCNDEKSRLILKFINFI